MLTLTEAPVLWSVEVVVADAANTKFDVNLTYRAYYQHLLVPAVVRFTQLNEPLPAAFWSAMVPPAMAQAYTDLGYNLPA